MTPREFYERLSDFQPVPIRMPPVSIKIGQADIMAAKLLLWLEDQLPDDATQGDLLDILDSARWWSIFWASVHKVIMDSQPGEDNE